MNIKEMIKSVLFLILLIMVTWFALVTNFGF